MLFQRDPLADGTWQAANLSPTPVVAYSYTGDYRIDCVIEGLSYRWNAGSSLGTPVTVTYSFMKSAPWYGGNEGADSYGFSQFTTAQKEAVRSILSKLQAELNIKFVEVSDSYSSYGEMRFGNNEQLYSVGYAWVPNAGGDVEGDVWIDSLTPSNMNPTVGSYAYATLVHEIGHALGLKHPGNYNAGTIAQDEPGNYLGTAEDNTNYTIMSYYDAAGGQPRDWFAMYDLLALKKLYGADTTYNAGNTVHAFTNASGTKLSIIDDAAGSDTIDLSAVTVGATVDMRPGTFSSVGKNGLQGAVNNVSIDTATTIENLIGTSGNDVVLGNEAANRFTLGQGNNTADGNGGIDTAVYAGTRASYQASASGETVTVSGTGLRDTLVDVERVKFSNIGLAFDLGGHAGETAKVIGAVLGADDIANEGLAGSGLFLLDGGTSYAGLLDFALDYVLGTTASNREVVDLLFTNIAGRAPTTSEAGYYTGLITNGSFTQAGLAMMAAETPENAWNVGLVGLAVTGLEFA
ncbi:MAG: M10 family metallopeptidase C-terminal domain-containing protein [Burkholderiales bacterium]|nr:M10 family metallopeptidase C-terminal domain-containing protein [Burkholderiales bacterium]